MTWILEFWGLFRLLLTWRDLERPLLTAGGTVSGPEGVRLGEAHTPIVFPVGSGAARF